MDRAENTEIVDAGAGGAVDTTPTDAAVETTTPETGAAVETDVTPEAAATETEPVALPAEVQATLDAYEAERQAWGPSWEIRDFARTTTEKFLRGDTEEFLAASLSVSEPKTHEHVHNILVAGAAEHVAREHGISPAELARRLGPAAEVQIPRQFERAIAALGEEDAKVVTDLIGENTELRKQLADAKGVVRDATGQVSSLRTQQQTTQFTTEFYNWQTQLIAELAAEAPDGETLTSILELSNLKFRQSVDSTNPAADAAAAKAFNDYYQAIARGENPKVIKSVYEPPVKAHLSRLIEKQLATFKVPIKAKTGQEPKKPETPKPGPKPPAQAPKVLGAKPGGAEQPGGAKPGGTEEVPLYKRSPSEQVAAVMASIAAEKEAAAKRGA